MVNFSLKDQMTGPERFQALRGGQPVDRVPFNPMASGLTARLYNIDLGDFYRDPELAFEAGLSFMKRFPWMSARPSYSWADRGAWEFGGQITWPDQYRYAAPVSLKPVITDPDQVNDLADPDPYTAGMNPMVARFNELSRNHGFPASLPGGTPTTITAGVIGREKFLRWLIKYPEAIHEMQRKAVDFIKRTAEITMEKFGPENCSVFAGVPMESNQLISPAMFEKFCKPYIREIMTFYLSSGVNSALVHLCGDHTANLPHWKDIPLPPYTLFSIGFEMDLETTAQVIGPRQVLAGNLHNSILHLGTSDQVKTEVNRCLTAGMKHEGGFVLMPACGMSPFTPVENLETVGETLFEHGYYN